MMCVNVDDLDTCVLIFQLMCLHGYRQLPREMRDFLLARFQLIVQRLDLLRFRNEAHVHVFDDIVLRLSFRLAKRSTEIVPKEKGQPIDELSVRRAYFAQERGYAAFPLSRLPRERARPFAFESPNPLH